MPHGRETEFRQLFTQRMVVLDIICYRRSGITKGATKPMIQPQPAQCYTQDQDQQNRSHAEP